MGQFRSSLWSSSPPSLSHGPHHLTPAHFHFLPPSSPTYGPHDLSLPYFYSSSCSFCSSSSVYFASLSFFLLSSWLSPSSINTDFSNTVTLCFSSRIYASGRGGKSPSKVFREVGRALPVEVRGRAAPSIREICLIPPRKIMCIRGKRLICLPGEGREAVLSIPSFLSSASPFLPFSTNPICCRGRSVPPG